MITKTCEICGNYFSVKPYRADKARFCSLSCGGKWHMANRKMPNEHKFGNQWRKGIRPTNAFTSEQAKAINTVHGEIHECAQCKMQFELKPWIARQNVTKSGRRFCSKSCHSTYMAANFSGENSPQWVGGPTTYRGKGWIKARALAVARDGGKCQDCGKIVGDSISVHHIKPYRFFTSSQHANDLSNLICLCQSCHMKAEQR